MNHTTISMAPKVRYVTQSSVYDRLIITGKLTDRRIAHLTKKSFYGKDAQRRANRLERKKRFTLKDWLKGHKK